MSVEDVTAITGALAGTLALAGALTLAIRRGWRGLRNLVHTIDRIEHVLNRELTHNHGTSIKDDITGLAVGLGTLHREVDSIGTRVDTLASLTSKHHPEDTWQIYPPGDPE